MALTPVDYDPFAASTGGATSNRAATLTPVDYDPFAKAPAKAAAPAAPERKTGSWLDVAKASVDLAWEGFKEATGGVVQGAYEAAAGIGESYAEERGGSNVSESLRGDFQAQREGVAAEAARGDLPGQAMSRASRASQEATRKDLNVDPNSLKGFALDAGVSLGQMAPGVLGSIATRSVVPGVASIAALSGGQKYSQSREAGRTPSQALTDAGVFALAEGIPEALPLGHLIKPGGKILKRIAVTASEEAATEILTQAIQDGYDAGVVGEDMTWKQAFENMARAGILGAAVGGGLAAATAPLPGAVEKIAGKLDERRDAKFAQTAGYKAGVDADAVAAMDPNGYNPADVRQYAPPAGIAPRVAPAVNALPTVEITAADNASALPNDLIAEGKAVIEGAKAATTPNGLDPLFDENDSQIGWIDPTNGKMTPLGETPAAPVAPAAEPAPAVTVPTGLVAPTGPLADALGQAAPVETTTPMPAPVGAANPSPAGTAAGTSAQNGQGVSSSAPTSNTGRTPTNPPRVAAGASSEVVTERGRKVETRLEAVDMADLIPSDDSRYDAALQPRDRAGRAQSAVQVAEIAAKLDPARLGANRLASQGAPIVGADNMVESGNGRTMAIREAYASHPERAAAYRAMIEAEGIDTTGMAAPVLVRRRLTELSPADRLEFVREANEDATSRMSAPEQAKVDAGRIAEALPLYRGGELTAATNRAFLRAFVEAAVSPAGRGQFIDKDGNPSADGVSRVRRALLAKAYGDSPVIAGLSESLDVNIKAIASALAEVAPRLALLKAELDAAGLAGEYDIGPELADMAALISRARDEGVNVSVLLAQTDAFSGAVSPLTEDLVRLAFKDGDTKKPRGASKLIEALTAYADGVDAELERLQQGDGLFGATVPATSREIINAAGKRVDGPVVEQGGIFDAAQTGGVVAEETGAVGDSDGEGGLASEVAQPDAISPQDARIAEIKAKLKAKFAAQASQVNTGLDPEIISLGAELAYHYIAKGTRRMAAVARVIAAELDLKMAQVRPYIRQWYNGAVDQMTDAGEDVSGLDTREQMQAAMAELLKPSQATSPAEAPAPVAAAQSPAATAPAIVKSDLTIADTSTGKGVIIKGATTEQIEAMKAAAPNASVVPNAKNGDVIVIKGRGRSPLVLPSATPPAVLDTWAEVKERLDDRVDTARERAGAGNDSAPAATADLFDTGAVSPGAGKPAGQADNGGRAGGNAAAPAGGGKRAGTVDAGNAVANGGSAGAEQQLAAGTRSDAVAAGEGAIEGGPASNAVDEGRGRDVGAVSDDAVSGRVARQNDEVETDYQVQYSPASNAEFAVGTLVPKNMQTAATKALDNLAARVGSIDRYVADKLGYTPAQVTGNTAQGVTGYFSAEQVDAIALAIDNIERGGGFIIGDQTGVGKGRFVAAMLRYGQRQGMVPVFVTKDPGLYADMIRDMRDIGMGDIDKRVFVSNVDLRGENAIPLSDEAGDSIQSLTKAKHKAAVNTIMETGALPDGYDMLFTTYSQMQYGPKGLVYDRQTALLGLGPNAMVVLDESHEAGGQGDDARKVTKEGVVIPTRADFVRQFLGLSKGAIYSSATYAKNPQVMSLYFKTDLGNAVEKIEQLGNLIESGGMPLQQVVANMLVESGQYLRRERSFDGVGMALDTMDTNEEMAKGAADALRQVFRLDVDFMETAREEFGDKLAAEMGDNMLADNAVSEASASSVGFASVMHNVVSQMLLALKAPAVVDRAIELHNAGQKPIIALSNTNESILDDYIEGAGLKPGDDAALTFNHILLRYLDRLRRITVKDPDGIKSHVMMSDADIAEHGGPDALETFLAVEKMLTEIDLSDLPASPVDYIIDRLNAAGIRTGEITGRGVMMSNGKYLTRKASSAEKKRAMNGYNSGVAFDALVINRSGSTGFSMHATGKKGNDGKQRHMIVLQPDSNIDVFMQMLGRIHRTGQILLPNYTIAISNLAVEKRLAAVLMRKMASLNANTTASKKSAISLDNVTDFMNQYGDQVVAEYLRDNPGLSELTNIRLAGNDSIPGIASRLTGRMAIMPPEEVVKVYEDIERNYRQYIEMLDSMGLNALEAKRLDLDAKLMKAEELVPAKDPSSPFGRAAIIETLDVKRIGKPYTLEEVAEQIATELDGAAGYGYAKGVSDRLLSLIGGAQVAADKAIARLTDEAKVAKTEKQLDRVKMSLSGWQAKRSAIEEQTKKIADRIRDFEPGTPVTLVDGAGDDKTEISGFILGVDASGIKDNPTAASNITIRIAIADAGREVRLPLSKIVGDTPIYTIEPASKARVNADFELGAGNSRETRQVITGNLLGGFAKLGKGQIIIFTDSNGATRQGIMMPKKFNANAALDRLAVKFENPAHILQFVKGDPGKRMVKGASDVIAITSVPGTYQNQWNNDTYNLAITVAEGKPYFLNKDLRRLVGDLGKRGKVMRPERALTGSQMQEAITILQGLGVEFETQTNKPAARLITGDKGGLKDVTTDLRAPREPESDAKLSAPMSAGDKAAEKSDEPWATPIRESDPSFDADIATAAQLEDRLVEVGIAEDVALSVVRGIRGGAQGYYDHSNKALVVALNQTPGHNTLRDYLGTGNHEILHALRALKLWTPEEWKALVKGAYKLGFMRDVEARWGPTYLGYGWSGERLQDAYDEEGVAELFRVYSQTTAEIKLEEGLKGVVARAVWRLIHLLEALHAYVRGQKPALNLLRKADAGEIGARPRQMDSGEGEGPKFNMPAASVMGRDTTQPNVDTANAIEERASALTAMIGRFKDGNAVNAAVDRWRTALQDQFLPLRRKQEATGVDAETDAYQAQELQSGRTGARLERLADKHVKPLLKAMAMAKVSRDELESFLYARHAPERNARIASINTSFGEGEGSGMTDNEAMAIMAEVGSSGRRPVLEQLARRVDAMLKESVQTRVDAGLMSQADADAWAKTYEYYVPLRGNAELDPELNSDRPRRGPGITVRGKESKRALGRASQASDLLAYSITQAEEAIVRAEINRVAVSFLELAKANPEPGFWSIALVTRKAVFNTKTQQVDYIASNRIAAEDADYTVVAKVDGKERRVVLNRDNPDAVRLAAAMKNLDASKTNALVNMLGGVNRFLSAVNTSLNPEFVITNAFRDIEAASINLQQYNAAGLTKRVLRDYPKAMRATFGGAFKTDTASASDEVKAWRRWHDEFVMDGGRVFFNNVEDVAAQRKKIERELKDLQSGPGPMKAIRSVWDFIGDVNTGVENAVRLSAYKGARESGMSRADAASLAKNLTVNFNRRGTYGAAINAFYLFYNASIQGTVTMLRAMRSPRVRKVLAGIVASGAALEILNQMLSGDDDDGEKFYDKISDFDKARNLIVMLPGGDNGQHLKIPLPYGYNGFFQLGRSGVELANGKKVGGVLASLAQTFADSFNPVGGTNSLLNLIAPTIADPVVDLVRNRDFADRPIMPDERQFGPKTPDNQRYWGSIDPVSKAITDTLNELTGGDDVVPGSIDVSPETLQYLFQYATGAAGAFFGTKLPKLLAAAISPEARAEFTTNDIPMVRKLTGDKPAYVDKEAFYERRAEVEQAEAYVKRYTDAGDSAGAQAYRAQNSALLAMKGVAKASTAALKEVKKARDQLDTKRERGFVTDEAAAARKAQLKAREETIITNFNKVYVSKVKAAA